MSMTPEILEATRLWTLAAPTVSAFVASLVRDFQERDDVLQETAVAVPEFFGRYDPSQSFVGWAVGIAGNQVWLYCRRKSRARIMVDSDAVDALARAFADQTPHDSKLDRIGECLGALNARSRDLRRLRYEQDLKPVNIGERLEVAANAVAKALQRVRDARAPIDDNPPRESGCTRTPRVGRVVLWKQSVSAILRTVNGRASTVRATIRFGDLRP
ncbi:MAG: sigma-70 family RNA polymerase sigma factor [Planctomycetia bacterium]